MKISKCTVFTFFSDEFKSKKRKQTKVVTVTEGEGQSEETSGVGGREDVSNGGSKRRRETLEGRIQSNPTGQLYIEWKENILRQARESLSET